MAGIEWTADEIAQIQTRYRVDRAEDIAADLARTTGSVRRMAARLGVSKYERLTTHYRVDVSAFEVLTSDTAYVLGLILADGSITGTRLKISNNDLDLMQAVRTALDSDHRLTVPKRVTNRCYSLVIRNARLVDGLRRWGITENKSLTATWPEVPDESFPDLLRGYFDGDGYVGYSPRGGLQVKFTSGSSGLLRGLATALQRRTPIPARAVQTDKGRTNAHRLWYYGENAAQIGRMMYTRDGIHILRKREVFLDYDRRYVMAPASERACR